MITYINKGLAMAGVGGHIISFENSKDKIYKIDKDFIKQYVENVWIVSTKERKARENVIKELHGLQRYFNEIEFPYGLIYFDGVYAGNIQKFYYDYTTLRSCLTDKSLTDYDKLYVLNYVLALIKKFAEYAYEEETELYNALLNAYDEVKKTLSRQERQLIMETLFNDEAETARLIYELPLKYGDKTLSGCRLFFPREQGLYKFWDAQDRPGLWACFGPFQLHLTPQQVLGKISISTGISPKEIISMLNILKNGISVDEYSAYPENLRIKLQQHVMVAMPGKKSAWLNPRIIVSDFSENIEPLKVDQIEASALVMEKIWDEVHNRLPYFNLACDLLIGELLLEFSRQNPIEKKQGNEKNLQIAIDYINMNIQHDINVNEIASAIGYSYDYFRHQFQKIYGIGIKEYIIKEKIKRIKQRLENTDDSLDLIAKDYSYSNQAHFSSSFKKVTGCTPSEYRKKINSRTKKILVKYSKKRTL